MKFYENFFDKSPVLKRETYVLRNPEASLREKLDLKVQKRKNASFVSKQRKINKSLALPTNSKLKVLAFSFAGLMLAFLVLPSTPLMSTFDKSLANEQMGERVYFTAATQSLKVSDKVDPINITRDTWSVVVRPSLSFAGMKTAPTFINDERAKVQYPFGLGAPIADSFGPRTPICVSSGSCSKPFHSGTDFTPGEGTPIQVIADGVVSTVKDSGDSGFGYHVIIEHVIDGEKVTSVYGHMQRGSSPLVVGQAVQLGDLVGKVGSTGISTGAHLHFEIHVNGVPIDAMTWDKWNTK